jgi:hypothetical protein
MRPARVLEARVMLGGWEVWRRVTAERKRREVVTGGTVCERTVWGGGGEREEEEFI